MGKALHALSGDPEVLRTSQELYELSLIRPHRTIASTGFAEGEMRSVDAAMRVVPGAQNGEAHGAEALERTPKVDSRS